MRFRECAGVLLGLTALLMTTNCGKHTPTAPPPSVDMIEIVSVQPQSSLPPDSLFAFRVSIRYTLATQDSGVLMVGFNNGTSVHSFRMVSAVDRIIGRGSGWHVFQVSAMTKYWGAEGSFAAYVNLSPYPHGSSWHPLATDTQDLTVGPPV